MKNNTIKLKKSWVTIPVNSDFSIYNIPFGVFKKKEKIRLGSAIGNYVIDLNYLHKKGYFKAFEFSSTLFENTTLNHFISLGKKTTVPFRERLIELFSSENKELQNSEIDKSQCLIPMKDVVMLSPVNVPNYTDFYSSIEHATNVGSMFRDPNNALLPNWKHLPVGYHGRASSIIVSDTPVKRPKGQTKSANNKTPDFAPTKQLDFELEIAFITGKDTKLGNPIATEDAESCIFGFVLFNDWSARDIQVWEYVPLGPFLGKNFASSISPWIITLEALEYVRVKSPNQDPKVMSYLEIEGKKNFDINLEVLIQPKGGKENKVCKSNFKHMYWNINQQLAHHTINGCNIQIGDMYGSGTISGATSDSYGSMLELAWKGTMPLKLNDGTERTFINDDDTVIMRGYATKNGVRVGFGEVKTLILPS